MDRLGVPWTYALKGSWLLWALAVGAGVGLGVVGFQVNAPTDALTRAAVAVLLAVLPLLVIVDVSIRTLPNRIIYPTAALCSVLLGLSWVSGGLAGSDLLRALATACALGIYALTVVMIAPVGGYGLGDVRLTVLLGLVLGAQSWWLAVIALVIVPPLLALAPMAVLVLFKPATRVGLPFGPFLAAGAIVAILDPDLLFRFLG